MLLEGAISKFGRSSTTNGSSCSDLHTLIGPHTLCAQQGYCQESLGQGTVVVQLKKGIPTSFVWLVNHHLHFVALFNCEAASLHGLVQAQTLVDLILLLNNGSNLY